MDEASRRATAGDRSEATDARKATQAQNQQATEGEVMTHPTGPAGSGPSGGAGTGPKGVTSAAPMTGTRRLAGYVRQSNRAAFTPRQWRRYRHKANRSTVGAT